MKWHGIRLVPREIRMAQERSKLTMGSAALGTACAMAAGAVLGAVARFAAAPAHAEHSHDPHYHLGSILHYDDPETTCAAVLDGSASQESVVAALRDVLDNPAHRTEDWDDTSFIDFRGQVMTNPCPSRSQQEHIRQYVYVTRTPPGGGDGAQTFWFAYDDPLSGHSGVGMPEYRVSEIYIRTGYLTPHLVNHEVGHSLGLCDGGPTFPAGQTCDQSGIAGWCTGSVMHSYGCSNTSDWPTESDRTAVAELRYWGGGSGCRSYVGGGCI